MNSAGKDCGSLLLLCSYSSSAGVWILCGLQSFWEYFLCHGARILWPWCWHCCFSLFFCFSACAVFIPSLTDVFTEAPPAWRTGSAVSCDVALGGTGRIWHTTPPALFSRRPTLQSPHCQHLATYMDVHVIGAEVVARVLTRAAVLPLWFSASLSLFPYPWSTKGWKESSHPSVPFHHLCH